MNPGALLVVLVAVASTAPLASAGHEVLCVGGEDACWLTTNSHDCPTSQTVNAAYVNCAQPAVRMGMCTASAFFCGEGDRALLGVHAYEIARAYVCVAVGLLGAACP